MHGEVRPAIQHSGLDLLHEDSLPADTVKGGVRRLSAVTDRVDVQLLDGLLEPAGDQIGLEASQRARSGGRSKGHRSNRPRSESAIRWPLSVPTASLRRTVGSWLIFATS